MAQTYPSGAVVRYGYDALGRVNQISVTPAGGALTIVYHYDLRGNLLTETTAAGTPIRTYVWREAADDSGLDVPIAHRTREQRRLRRLERHGAVHLDRSSGRA